MIEIDFAKISKVCVQQLEILAATRRMCEASGAPVDWIWVWEEQTAQVLHDVRLVKAAKGDVIIFDD